MLPTGLLVVHDTGRGGKDDLTERTGGEEQVDPVLDRVNGDVETRRDDTALVETTVELNDDLAATVVVNELKLADVACSSARRRDYKRARWTSKSRSKKSCCRLWTKPQPAKICPLPISPYCRCRGHAAFSWQQGYL